MRKSVNEKFAIGASMLMGSSIKVVIGMTYKMIMVGVSHCEIHKYLEVDVSICPIRCRMMLFVLFCFHHKVSSH